MRAHTLLVLVAFSIYGCAHAELGWRYGYPLVLAIMSALFIAMIITFWRWGWIGRQSDLK